MRVFEAQIITNGDMSETTITSDVVGLLQLSSASIQAYWDGASASGILKLQFSNDYDPNFPTLAHWTDMTGMDTIIIGPGNFGWAPLVMSYPYVRLFYTKGSGTGTLNATVYGKEI